MGYEEVPGTKDVIFRDLSAGWFPGREHNDIPGSLTTPNDPAGMQDGNAVVWLLGGLRSFFGYDNVNTVALNSGATVTSLFPSEVLREFVTTVGNKLFKDADETSPTDITGSATITPDLQIKWAEWQFETTKFIIGTNGTDSPIKWTGTGNAEVLGGTPPVGRWVTIWNNSAWIASTSTQPSTVFFSDLGDPEAWTTDNSYKFDAPITGMARLGDKMVVFKDSSIGILSGFNNLRLTKTDILINGIGCSGGHTITTAKIRGKEVLIFHSYSGLYAFDGSQNLLDLSHPIRNKYISGSSTTRWNDTRFSKAWATYIPKYSWYMLTLSDGGDSTNDFMVIIDLDRVQETKEGSYLPHWPVDAIPGNCIVGSKSLTSETDEIFFADETGFIYKFDPSIFNNNGDAYNKFYQSKIYDNISSWIVGEANILGDETSTVLTVSVNADLEAGDGESGTVDLNDGADVLDTFIIGSSQIGGKDFVFKDASIDNFGRFLQFKVSNGIINNSFVIEEINFVLQEFGLEPNAKQE